MRAVCSAKKVEVCDCLYGRATPWLRSVCFFLFMAMACYGNAAEAPAENEQDEILPEVVAVSEEEATVVGLDEYPDPLENFNRVMFRFNDVVYTYVAAPVGDVYGILPAGVRSGISRVFLNVREPLNLVNNLAQGELGSAGRNALRFITNTTIGIGGIFDPASSLFGVEPKPSGFNETFTRYGIGSGPYLVLPLLGATDVRGGVGRIFDTTFHPVRLISDEPDTTYLIVFDNFQRVIPQIENYVELRTQANDPYVYFRNQYLQGVSRDREALTSKSGTPDE